MQSDSLSHGVQKLGRSLLSVVELKAQCLKALLVYESVFSFSLGSWLLLLVTVHFCFYQCGVPL